MGKNKRKNKKSKNSPTPPPSIEDYDNGVPYDASMDHPPSVILPKDAQAACTSPPVERKLRSAEELRELMIEQVLLLESKKIGTMQSLFSLAREYREVCGLECRA